MVRWNNTDHWLLPSDYRDSQSRELRVRTRRCGAHLAGPRVSDATAVRCLLYRSYVIPHLSKRDYPYNVVLTGSGTFFNSRWLYVYSHELPKKVRDYVDEHFNCEDIAFNMMMSNVTGLPPVLSFGSTHTTHSVKESASAHKGLRTRHGHSSGRSECIKHLVKMYVGRFGRMGAYAANPSCRRLCVCACACSFKRNPLVDSHFMVTPFTFDVPALKAILKSTQIYTQKPTWYPSKPSKP